jgi:hypothetical protein
MERASDKLREELESDKKRKKVESTPTTDEDCGGESQSGKAMDRFYKILTSVPTDCREMFEDLVTTATPDFFGKEAVMVSLATYEGKLSAGHDKNECLTLLKDQLINEKQLKDLEDVVENEMQAPDPPQGWDWIIDGTGLLRKKINGEALTKFCHVKNSNTFGLMQIVN